MVLARAWLVLRNARDTRHEPAARSRWEKAETRFRLTIAELNRRIDAWNLKTPALAFQRNRIEVEREIDRITN